MSGNIRIVAQQSVALEDLADYIALNANRSDLKEFILRIDEVIADLEFTKDLHETLGEVIALEEE